MSVYFPPRYNDKKRTIAIGPDGGPLMLAADPTKELFGFLDHIAELVRTNEVIELRVADYCPRTKKELDGRSEIYDRADRSFSFLSAAIKYWCNGYIDWADADEKGVAVLRMYRISM
ncbi:MAG: hypothetical protein LBP82_00530 [Candidatus Methanoplasma sp.]|nr:hypothetical protein [Candidatus Methanoplasma sp.]